MRRINPDASLIAPFAYTQQQLPTDKPVVVYIRQSSEGQVQNHKQSAILQDEQLARRLTTMGFTDIIKIDADQGMSGQKRRDERSGLDHLYKLVESGQVGAIATFSPSRLYRDLTRRFYTDFVAMLEALNVPLITYNRIFWANNRNDMDALIDKFAEAARFIEEEIHGKLIPAKLQSIESGNYGGHTVPVGFIVAYTDDRKYYVVYEEHAKLVRWLYARYRALHGNLAKLIHELASIGFKFPAFKGVAKIPHIGLRFDGQGYQIKARSTIVSILTNPAYIGWYCYKGAIISKTSHEPIVNMDDFMFAFTRLSPYTLDGEINENKPVVSKRRGSTHNALLDGLLTNNTYRMYVNNRSDAYEARQCNQYALNKTVLCVSVEIIDRTFTSSLLMVLIGLEQRQKDGIHDALQEQLVTLATQKTEEVQSLDIALQNIKKGIKQEEVNKRIALEENYEQGVRDAIIQLKRLHKAKEELEEKLATADREVTDLQESVDLIQCAINRWESLSFEKQQKFVNLLVQSANIQELSPFLAPRYHT